VQNVGEPFTLDDILKFLGILFYMTLHNKGSYRNHWGLQEDAVVFASFPNYTPSSGLGTVMSIKRFDKIRESLSFHDVPRTS